MGGLKGQERGGRKTEARELAGKMGTWWKGGKKGRELDEENEEMLVRGKNYQKMRGGRKKRKVLGEE